MIILSFNDHSPISPFSDFDHFSLLIILSFNDHSPISSLSDFENFALMTILLLVMQGKTEERKNEGNSDENTQDKTADHLAQLVEDWSTVWEVMGSNPGWTNMQGL